MVNTTFIVISKFWLKRQLVSICVGRVKFCISCLGWRGRLVFPGYVSNLWNFSKAQRFPFVLLIVKLTLKTVRNPVIFDYFLFTSSTEGRGGEGRSRLASSSPERARSLPISPLPGCCVLGFFSPPACPRRPSPPAASPSWWTFWCWCSSPSLASSSSPTSSTCCEDASPVRWPAPDVGFLCPASLVSTMDNGTEAGGWGLPP